MYLPQKSTELGMEPIQTRAVAIFITGILLLI